MSCHYSIYSKLSKYLITVSNIKITNFCITSRMGLAEMPFMMFGIMKFDRDAARAAFFKATRRAASLEWTSGGSGISMRVG
jgi:hypothetical protein